MAITVVLQALDARAHGAVGADVGGPVDALGDGLHLLPQRVGVVVDEAEAVGLLAQRHHLARQVGRAGAALGPVACQHAAHAALGQLGAQQRVLGIGVLHEVVDRHHAGQAVGVADVVDVALEVHEAALQRAQVFARQVLDVVAAVELQRAHGGHHHRGRRPQAALAALDVDELLGPQVGAEAGLGHHVVGQLQRGARGQHRVAAVRDVGERPAVDEGRVVLQRLHQVGRQRVAQQSGHRALGLQVAGAYGLLITGAGHHDAAQPRLQVGQAGGQAQDGHDLGGHHDVEAVLPRVAVARAAQAHGDVAQRAVVHVHHALPRDAAHVDAQRVAVVHVVVDQCRQQVVRQRDGREVTGEVQVDVLHRHHLRVAAAGRAALHAEHRAQRGLAQADQRLLADAVERIAQAHGGGGLALAGRCGADGRDEDELAVGPLLQRVQVGQRDLGLVVAIRHQVLVGNAQPVAGDVAHALQCGPLGDLDVRGHGNFLRLEADAGAW